VRLKERRIYRNTTDVACTAENSYIMKGEMSGSGVTKSVLKINAGTTQQAKKKLLNY